MIKVEIVPEVFTLLFTKGNNINPATVIAGIPNNATLVDVEMDPQTLVTTFWFAESLDDDAEIINTVYVTWSQTSPGHATTEQPIKLTGLFY